MAESIDDVRGRPEEASVLEDAGLPAILGTVAAAEPAGGVVVAIESETLKVSFEG